MRAKNINTRRAARRRFVFVRRGVKAKMFSFDLRTIAVRAARERRKRSRNIFYRNA